MDSTNHQLPLIVVDGNQDDRYGAQQPVIVPSTACVWVMILYITIATIMFAEWEHWNYLDSAYFVTTSLMKIGLGDFVPGTSASGRTGPVTQETSNTDSNANQTKLVINFLFLLIGMGLVAMCYYLMREEVKMKMRQLKEEIKTRCSSSSSSDSIYPAEKNPARSYNNRPMTRNVQNI
jgi:Trk-type K+ transport system membrane component